VSTQAILITQCLQNDFVKPIGRYDPLPNMLHVGFSEARRLMGENPHEGPVARMMQWAYQQSEEELMLIHIRDWHDPNDPFQAEHLRQFGPHCLMNTEGARFAFDDEFTGRHENIVQSPGLNDFIDTNFAKLLEPYAKSPMRVGLMGVWTEAKISFLAYDLRTRYPQFQIGVCSALCASSSRAQHFIALDQLQKLLGVHVFASIGEFTRYLLNITLDTPLALPASDDTPSIALEGLASLSDTDRKLVRYLFRDCREVKLRAFSGGFSGNLVFGAESVDTFGQKQVPHVVKVGAQKDMGRERTAFERVESVLGNSAPRITEFADFAERGGLKYRYAAMGGGFSTTFQKMYMQGLNKEKTERILRTVFEEQLGRFYTAGTLERVDLFDYYVFKPEIAKYVRPSVEKVYGKPANSAMLRFDNGREFPNLCVFYEQELANLPSIAGNLHYMAYVHGDLNGANIIVDSHENVWLIDFFHTHRGHVLKDLVKFENDLLYIMTPVANADDFDEALRLTDFLMQVEDLGKPLPDVEMTGLTNPNLVRAYETVSLLRSFYPPLIHEARDPLQLHIAQLRYAAHTVSFDEPNLWQRQWALYTASLCAQQIVERLQRSGPLRVDWLAAQYTQAGKLGLTILPGRRDYQRELDADLASLKQQNVSHVVCLIAPNEFGRYGVDNLLQAYQEAGFSVHHRPIMDQRVCSLAEMRETVQWISGNLAQGANIMVHCVGGLGRSGTVAASYLKSQGLDTDAAIAEVRRARSPRAIETKLQEDFVAEFAA
jgi:protein-tyrosine phosphatase/nicotinamidase-related amidase